MLMSENMMSAHLELYACRFYIMYKLYEIQFIYAMHVNFTYYKELKIFHFAK